jgi:hypothetical protein
MGVATQLCGAQRNALMLGKRHDDSDDGVNCVDLHDDDDKPMMAVAPRPSADKLSRSPGRIVARVQRLDQRGAPPPFPRVGM